jgi:hypothetical protein
VFNDVVCTGADELAKAIAKLVSNSEAAVKSAEQGFRNAAAARVKAIEEQRAAQTGLDTATWQGQATAQLAAAMEQACEDVRAAVVHEEEQQTKLEAAMLQRTKALEMSSMYHEGYLLLRPGCVELAKSCDKVS